MIRALEQDELGKQKRGERTHERWIMIYGENPKLHQRSRHLTTPLRHDFTTLMTKKNFTTILRHDFLSFALLMKLAQLGFFVSCGTTDVWLGHLGTIQNFDATVERRSPLHWLPHLHHAGQGNQQSMGLCQLRPAEVPGCSRFQCLHARQCGVLGPHLSTIRPRRMSCPSVQSGSSATSLNPGC